MNFFKVKGLVKMKELQGVALNSRNPDERVIRISYPKNREDIVIEILEKVGIKIKRKSYSH